MLAQMNALTLAGHETTANTIAWLFYELARHTEFQDKLRAEVLEKRRELATRGEQDYNIEDLESMKYLQAAITVSARMSIPIDMILNDAIIGNSAISSYSLPHESCRCKRRCHSTGISYHNDYGKAHIYHSCRCRPSHYAERGCL